MEPSPAEQQARKMNRRLKAAHVLVRQELRVLEGIRSSSAVLQTRGRDAERANFAPPTTRNSEKQSQKNTDTVEKVAAILKQEGGQNDRNDWHRPPKRVTLERAQPSRPADVPVPPPDVIVEPIRSDLTKTTNALEQLLEAQRSQQKEMAAIRRALQVRPNANAKSPAADVAKRNDNATQVGDFDDGTTTITARARPSQNPTWRGQPLPSYEHKENHVPESVPVKKRRKSPTRKDFVVEPATTTTWKTSSGLVARNKHTDAELEQKLRDNDQRLLHIWETATKAVVPQKPRRPRPPKVQGPPKRTSALPRKVAKIDDKTGVRNTLEVVKEVRNPKYVKLLSQSTCSIPLQEPPASTKDIETKTYQETPIARLVAVELANFKDQLAKHKADQRSRVQEPLANPHRKESHEPVRAASEIPAGRVIDSTRKEPTPGQSISHTTSYDSVVDELAKLKEQLAEHMADVRARRDGKADGGEEVLHEREDGGRRGGGEVSHIFGNEMSHGAVLWESSTHTEGRLRSEEWTQSPVKREAWGEERRESAMPTIIAIPSTAVSQPPHSSHTSSHDSIPTFPPQQRHPPAIEIRAPSPSRPSAPVPNVATKVEDVSAQSEPRGPPEVLHLPESVIASIRKGKERQARFLRETTGIPFEVGDEGVELRGGKGPTVWEVMDGVANEIVRDLVERQASELWELADAYVERLFVEEFEPVGGAGGVEV
ncbi:hypothetical protein HDV00_004633 [Rhizophlyctis rosea]|nr:hypothetical protein HDV00_004633 [Rhizophlyctis rosea]